MMKRRTLLAGIAATLAAPALCRAENLMSISPEPFDAYALMKQYGANALLFTENDMTVRFYGTYERGDTAHREASAASSSKKLPERYLKPCVNSHRLTPRQARDMGWVNVNAVYGWQWREAPRPAGADECGEIRRLSR